MSDLLDALFKAAAAAGLVTEEEHDDGIGSVPQEEHDVGFGSDPAEEHDGGDRSRSPPRSRELFLNKELPMKMPMPARELFLNKELPTKMPPSHPLPMAGPDVSVRSAPAGSDVVGSGAAGSGSRAAPRVVRAPVRVPPRRVVSAPATTPKSSPTPMPPPGAPPAHLMPKPSGPASDGPRPLGHMRSMEAQGWKKMEMQSWKNIFKKCRCKAETN